MDSPGDTSPIHFQYSALEKVHVGESAAQGVTRSVVESGAQRVLLVGSSSLAARTDGFSSIRQALARTSSAVKLEVYSRIRAHTPREDVLDAVTRAKQFDADLLVSVGGGSIIDACKVIQLALDQNLTTAEDLLAYAQSSDGHRGARAGDMTYFDKPSKVRQIAIPTTLSGAEFSNNAGVLNTENSSKEGYRGRDLCPREILYDPELATLTPEWLWLSTAIRSLDHAIEGYCSADSHRFVQGHFLQAMKLFAESLPATRANLDDLKARSLSQQAVWLAGCGLGTVSHGASHGIGYVLGSLCGVPHGYTSCVMLPAVLEWNSIRNSQQQEPIAAALGRSSMTASQAVKELIGNLGLPTDLAAVGVSKNQLPDIAARAVRHPVVKKNPREITTAEQVEEILQLAW